MGSVSGITPGYFLNWLANRGCFLATHMLHSVFLEEASQVGLGGVMAAHLTMDVLLRLLEKCTRI